MTTEGMMADENRTEGLADTPEAANDSGTPDIETRLATAEAELAEAKDRVLRAMAEAENTRRRAQREKEEGIKYASSGFAKELLTVADNLRRALSSVDEGKVRDPVMKNLLAGVEATERELLGVFERNGIRRISPKGERFDHNLHQAIFEAPGTGQPAGTIVEVLQDGYIQHDRLLRPAMVGVAKGDGKPERVDTVA
jgi:molecular chaperone GrpE